MTTTTHHGHEYHRSLGNILLACALALVMAFGVGAQVNAGSAHHPSGAKGKQGGVTPVPNATPVKTRPGLTLGMITRPLSQVEAIQAAVNRHEKIYMFYLQPDQVVKHTLQNYGFTSYTLVSPERPFPRYAGRPVRKGEVKYQNKLYQVFVAQPLQRGPKGVWVIVTILPQKLITGPISHPSTLIQRIQGLANNDKADGLIFLDPDRVVQEELPQYGFVPTTSAKGCSSSSPGYKIISPARVVPPISGRPAMLSVVEYQGTRYNVYLVQPRGTGKGGIWVISAIEPAV